VAAVAVGRGESDPAFRAVAQAFVHADPREQAGGPLDVRVVVAGIRAEARAGFLLEEVPWDRFPHGADVRQAMERVRSGDPAALDGALGRLGGLCANDARAAVAPAVPFLIRIAADPAADHRVGALAVTAAAARLRYHGVCTRADMLRIPGEDEWHFEVTGYPQNWSVQAAREAVAAEAGLLLPLLDDADPEVRLAAAYALAATASRAGEIRAACRARLCREQDPTVRAGLVLAIAQLGRTHPESWTVDWLHDRWSDPARPPEVRLGAALGWLCLTELPVPDGLRELAEGRVSDGTARSLASLPWLRAVERVDGDGLHRCLRAMLHPDEPDTGDFDDPWSPVWAEPAAGSGG
jgi:hypothetical protein